MDSNFVSHIWHRHFKTMNEFLSTIFTLINIILHPVCLSISRSVFLEQRLNKHNIVKKISIFFRFFAAIGMIYKKLFLSFLAVQNCILYIYISILYFLFSVAEMIFLEEFVKSHDMVLILEGTQYRSRVHELKLSFFF